jgi:hypothetical protein
MAINDIRLNDADRAILRALEDRRNLATNLEDEIDYERHDISQRLGCRSLGRLRTVRR